MIMDRSPGQEQERIAEGAWGRRKKRELAISINFIGIIIKLEHLSCFEKKP